MGNPWYPHYPGDYARDTAHLTLIEHGAYRLLLDHYYSTGAPLPADKQRLFHVCRAFHPEEQEAICAVLHDFFTLGEDGYHNKRVDAELVKRCEHHQRLSQAGKRGMEKRWADNQAINLAIASPQPQPEKQDQTPAAEPAAAPHKLKRSRSSSEQQINIEARDRRLLKEEECRKELNAGRNWISDQIAELARKKAV